MKNITIKNIASFDEKGISFLPKKINFIYGTNGSGKTTIANVLASIAKYPNCNIEWQNQNHLTALVYNRRFVHNNFAQSSEIAGIFTLGEQNINETKNIEEKQKELESNTATIANYKINIDQKNNILEKLIDDFKEECWKVYKDYQTAFGGAFEGFKTKQKFADKITALCQKNNNQNIAPYQELTKKSQAIFDKQASKMAEIAELILPNFADAEQNAIFKEIIIGKNEIDIAKMILKLNNSDWVKKGTDYLQASDQNCPFCQQKVTDDFKKQLDEYFDENYLQKIKELETAKEKYESLLQPLLASINQYKFANNSFLKLDSLIDLENSIKTKFEKNILTINNKIKEPSLKIKLEAIDFEAERVQKIIAKAVGETKEHNQLIDNLDKEKETLKSQIWAFIADDLKANYQKYHNTKSDLEKEIATLKTNQNQAEQTITLLKNEIAELETKITSTKPVINKINQTLANFGFTNFSLAEVPNQAKYKIIRNNGEDARLTLSEGEKTFITFLYFYHLTKGSFEKDKTTVEKILVIDDPISSLDSNILSVVSELVRKLIESCKTKQNNIKQIIILTHNQDFYRKITFKQNDENCSFFVLNKISDISCINQSQQKP